MVLGFMKQHIPAIIINTQLTQQERRKLKHSLSQKSQTEDWEGTILQKPLILGELIEFLDKHGLDTIIRFPDTWRINMVNSTMKASSEINTSEKELINALYKEVKQILEKK